MIILCDNGHGIDTSGKRSPDGKLLEYKWARQVADMIVGYFRSLNRRAELLVPEDEDIPLRERVRRVNEICRQEGSDNVLLVSIHNDAAGSDGRWHNAKGWSARVAPNASAGSKRLAECLAGRIGNTGLKVRRQYPDKGYWVQNLAICRDAKCPAVLTENGFMDNLKECQWLLDPQNQWAIAQAHIFGILDYLKTLQ